MSSNTNPVNGNLERKVHSQSNQRIRRLENHFHSGGQSLTDMVRAIRINSQMIDSLRREPNSDYVNTLYVQKPYGHQSQQLQDIVTIDGNQALSYYDQPNVGTDGIIVVNRVSQSNPNITGNMIAVANGGKIYLYEEKNKIAGILDLNVASDFLSLRDTNNNTTFTIDRQNGDLTMEGHLRVNGTHQGDMVIEHAVENGTVNLTIRNTDTDPWQPDADQGAAINLGGTFIANNNVLTDFARIVGAKEANNNWSDGYLSILLNRDTNRGIGGSPQLVERMRITSEGKMGVGTNSPQYLVDVNGTANFSEDIFVRSHIHVGDNHVSAGNRAVAALYDMANGSKKFITLGKKDFSFYNQGELGFYYDGVDNTTNYLQLGLYGVEGIKIYGHRTVEMVENVSVAKEMRFGNLTNSSSAGIVMNTSENGGTGYMKLQSASNASVYAVLDAANSTVPWQFYGNLTVNSVMGVGTRNPTSKLHVADTKSTASIRVDKHDNNTNVVASVEIGANDNGSFIATPTNESFTIKVGSTPIITTHSTGIDMHSMDMTNTTLQAPVIENPSMSNGTITNANINGSTITDAVLNNVTYNSVGLNEFTNIAVSDNVTASNVTAINLNASNLTGDNVTASNLTVSQNTFIEGNTQITDLTIGSVNENEVGISMDAGEYSITQAFKYSNQGEIMVTTHSNNLYTQEGTQTTQSVNKDIKINAGKDVVFQNGGNTHAILNQNGNFGIATQAPSELLDVNGNMVVGADSEERLYIGDLGHNNSYGLVNYNLVGNKSTSYAFMQDDNGVTRLNAPNTSTSGIQFAIDNDVKASVHSNGYFGIGTSSPAYPLDVVGNPRFNNNETTASIRLQHNTKEERIVYFEDDGDLMIGTTFGGFNGATNQGNNLILRAANDFHIYTNGPAFSSPNVTVLRNGNMGIGTSSPNELLELNKAGQNSLKIGSTDSSDVSIKLSTGVYDREVIKLSNNGHLNLGLMDTTHPNSDQNHTYLHAKTNMYFRANSTQVMGVYHSGNVGIGVSEPQYRLEVGTKTGYSGTAYEASFFDNGGGSAGTSGSGNITSHDWTVSANFQGRIFVNQALYITSDERIKKNIYDIDDATALQQLRKLKPKTYEYIDSIERNNTKVIGYLAQEVSDVIPEAVDNNTVGFIPSLYSNTNCSISTPNTVIFNYNDISNITLGDSIKFYLPNVATELIGDVTSVSNSDHTFTLETPSNITTDTTIDIQDINKAFLYGKKVNDFNRLNKQYIFTIATAALQEVDRDHEVTKQKLSETEQSLENTTNILTETTQKLSEAEQKIATLETKVSQLENMPSLDASNQTINDLTRRLAVLEAVVAGLNSNT